MQTSICNRLMRVAAKALVIERDVAPRFTGHEWETPTALRVLLRTEDGHETDIDYDKVTGCYRLWIDGVEAGCPDWQ